MLAQEFGVNPPSIRRWASEFSIRKNSLMGVEVDDPTNTPFTRRCKNKLCIERFVPVNTQHQFHEPACAKSTELWTREEIVAEEASLAVGTNQSEMALRFAGQKNKLLRENATLRSLREVIHLAVLESGRNQGGRYDPVPVPDSTGTGSTRELIVLLSDWQLGKWEGGIGVEVMMVSRIPRIKEAVLSILRVQQESGHKVDTIRLVWGGDMIEGCYIYGGQNVSGLDRTGNTHRLIRQLQLCAKLQAEMAIDMAAAVPNVIVEGVPGNHGRPNGKSDFADPEDNFDVLTLDWAMDKAANQPNITWNHTDNWWTRFDVLGHPVVAIHGDQWRGALEKVETILPRWVTSGEFGVTPELFITCHRHNPAQKEVQGVHVIQNGTIDGGSEYYQKNTGIWSRPEQTIVVASEARVAESIWPIDFEEEVANE